MALATLASPAFALACGLLILCGETCLHIAPLLSNPGDLSSWPVYVWATGLFLVYGAARANRDWLTGRAWLLAAWAFTASLLFGAFVDLLGELLAGAPPPPDEWIPLPVFVVLVGILLVLAVAGLFAVVHGERVTTHRGHG